MKVLHYCKTFSKLSETFIYDYVTGLEESGIENYVVTHSRVNNKDRPFEKVFVVDHPGRWHPERLIRRIGTKVKKEEAKLASWPITRKKLSKIVEKINPDIIHAHFGPEWVKVAPVAKDFNIPLVTTFYGYDISRLMESDFWLSRYKQLWDRTSEITVLSKEMKESILAIGAPEYKINIIHLGRDLSEFNFQEKRRPIVHFISVGRLTHKKGHFRTIEAVKKVVNSGSEIQLDIIGDGNLKNEIQQYIQRLGAHDVVSLLGALPNQEVIQKLKQADAFILCSETAPNGDREGTPTVLVEAQAMGLPCITTKHAGIPEMLPEKNHFLLAQEGNTEDICSKIRKLQNCSDSELKEISIFGREKVENDFNLQKEVTKLIDLYSKHYKP